jgi:MFS family permease
VYSTYALTVIPCLLVFGPWSDAVGRRAVLLAGVVLGALAAGVFAAARGVAWLFAAQVVEGVAMAAVQGSAVPALVETHPHEDRARASLVGSATTVAGAALGPLAAGLIATIGPWPRRVPYLVELPLLVATALVLWAALPRRDGAARQWRPLRPSVPASIRPRFTAAATAAFLAWAVVSLFLSLIPSYVSELLHTTDVALVGALAAVVLGCAAVVQLAARQLAARPSQAAGLLLVASASAALVVVAHVRHLPVIAAASVLAGLGLGLVFRGALIEVNAIAPSDRKGEVVASFYVVVYLGTALPVIGTGVVALATGLLTAVQVFGYVVGAGCLLTARAAARAG